ncbi:MAG: hypothetical protein QM764_18535 [Chitinophagaceae bacterium]
MKKIAFSFAVLLILATACSKSDSGTGGGNNSGAGALHEAGYGPSNVPFTAAAWTLPAGVELKDSIHEYSYCWNYPPYTSVEKKDWKGIPTGFTFCLTFTNTTNGVITITFPPELVFVSSSVEHQNILTIDIGTVIVNPGIATTIVVQGFCLNVGRTVPMAYDYSDEGQKLLSYSFGPSQIPGALKEVTDIVHAKHITMNDVLNADGSIDVNKSAKYSAIQAAIWEVTDENGLTKNTKDLLKNL